MQLKSRLELCATFTDSETARSIAEELKGRLYTDERPSNAKGRLQRWFVYRQIIYPL